MISRRNFLKSTGLASAAGVTVAYAVYRHQLPLLPSIYVRPVPTSGAGWMHMQPDGRCLLYTPRAEMGQHAALALAQIVAEELAIPVAEINLRIPSTADITEVMSTGGSFSMPLFAQPVARAAAVLRESLRKIASGQTGFSTAQLTHEGPGFRGPDGSYHSYREVTAGQALFIDSSDFEDVDTYTLNPERVHRYVGQPARPRTLQAMVTGAPLFTADLQQAGTLFGRVLRPPGKGARLTGANTDAAGRLAGVVQVVEDLADNFLGVVAETPVALAKAIHALDAAWTPVHALEADTVAALLDVDSALSGGAMKSALRDDTIDSRQDWDVDLRFEVQIQTHAQMEPRAAIAELNGTVGDRRLLIWTGSQDPFVVQRRAARQAGLDESRVIVQNMLLGGAFGGREHSDVEADAVRLALATGRRVKVQWTREDESSAARNRPPSSHRVRLRAGENGKLEAFWHAFVTGRHFYIPARFPPLMLAWHNRKGDAGAVNSAVSPYFSPAHRVEFTDIDLPVETGTWRSLAAAPNVFAYDCALDELALQRNLDPVQLRLDNLDPSHHRLAACLGRVRDIAAGLPLGKAEHSGRGFACGIYKESCIAACADVSANYETGEIRVERVVCSQDAGLAINPDQLRAQLEGSIYWGIGMALLEEVRFDRQGVATLNFDSYPIPRIRSTPEMVLDIISDRSTPPGAAGETGIIVFPAAIANALRRATGVRHTRLPMKLA